MGLRRGAKVYFLDHKLFLDASYYHIDWSNQQTNVNANGQFSYTLNVDKTVTDGVEVSTTYKPLPGLKGDRVPPMPFLSYSGQAEYERLLAGNLSGDVSTDLGSPQERDFLAR